MVPIRQDLCPAEKYSIKCPYTRTPACVVVHNTANDAPAKNEIRYMISNDNEVSFHYAVDDLEIVQGIPEERNVWGSGDGLGPGNMQGVHVEICYSKSGGMRFIQAEENAAEFIASLLKKYGWGIDAVTRHQDYNGKYCPHRTLDMGWERFLNMVEKFLKEEDDEMLSYEDFMKYMERYNKELAQKPVSGWAKAAWEEAVAAGKLDGTQPRAPLTREQYAAVWAKEQRKAD